MVSFCQSWAAIYSLSTLIQCNGSDFVPRRNRTCFNQFFHQSIAIIDAARILSVPIVSYLFAGFTYRIETRLEFDAFAFVPSAAAAAVASFFNFRVSVIMTGWMTG